MVKIGKLIVERRSKDEVRAIRQKQIDTIRAGGFAKQAAKAQAKLNKKGW